jgi:hypothetical protein
MQRPGGGGASCTARWAPPAGHLNVACTRHLPGQKFNESVVHIKRDRVCAVLALAVGQGRVDLGVRSGRGFSAARGTAETEAPEMPIDLGAR